ncbi:sigma-E factor negative regulatory protein [Pseudomarimonas salicorniae]|uniref:Sigma-E factor negative regulatory protein n=1 Tax=Pseudomarimonas salicorniae TaxID=2933270 RepID=A0ABT0GJT8_9GAMM|nr:sigma-E factor negative regulatory protein [Lysobacter sp. CAU 1642]MCK7594811.1 sigma-E factor negative regulatory protein [Lysobacter sp. CAU 1642]
MNEQIKEQLSALMDGELGKDQARFLHKRLESDAELRADWSRWHLARESLQGRVSTLCDASFLERVSAGIAGESTPRAGMLPTALRWAAGAAVAASVAVAALVALPQLGQAPGSPGPVAARPAGIEAPIHVVDSGVREADLRPSLGAVTQSVAATQGTPRMPTVQLDPRVDGWLLRHNAATLQPLHDSFVPYIPVVSPYRPPQGQVVLETGGRTP